MRKMSNEKILEEAGQYASTLKLMLHMEGTPVDTLSTSISSLETMVKENRNVSAHQLRNIFALIQSAVDIKGLVAIRPRLAYLGARQESDDGKVIAKVIDNLIQEIHLDNEHQKLKINGLKFIMEGIVAYHRYYNPKNS